MPPRYAYWTIIVDDQPTAFRAALQEDLMPTFKRLHQKHPAAKMMWFQNGKLWASRLDAQEAMRARGEIGRARDERQGGFRSRDRKPGAERGTARPEKLDWKPRESGPARRSPGAGAPRSERPEWKPKGSAPRSEKPAWQPRGSAPRTEKPAWQPRGSGPRTAKPEWRPRGEGRPPRNHETSRSEKLEWKPKGEVSGGSERRKWVPKAEYQKSKGIEARRDKNWRPGGEHKDPRQKYKDAKKAKWTRFKQTVRKRWESKPGKKSGK